MTENPPNTGLALRRQIVFGSAVLVAGLALLGLLLAPLFVSDRFDPQYIFATAEQENFFFDLLAFMTACWLTIWITAMIGWQAVARFAQWLGISLLCINQVNVILIWKMAADPAADSSHPGMWLTAGLLQMYLVGAFFGVFTLPGLTRDGNRKLTGLATLLVILPWVVARNEIVRGAHYLNGFLF